MHKLSHIYTVPQKNIQTYTENTHVQKCTHTNVHIHLQIKPKDIHKNYNTHAHT
jgi:hypothetical protein